MQQRISRLHAYDDSTHASLQNYRDGTRPGKDNLAPAEDVHNKNPSLVALGKNKNPH